MVIALLEFDAPKHDSILKKIRVAFPAMKIRVYQKTFLYFGKPLSLEEKKESSLGSEPVNKFLPSARFKLGINLVHDTV